MSTYSLAEKYSSIVSTEHSHSYSGNIATQGACTFLVAYLGLKLGVHENRASKHSEKNNTT